MNFVMSNTEGETKAYCPELTLCIPTFNRGGLAFKNLLSIMDRLTENLVVLILNNGSDVELEYYAKIEEISHKNSKIRYISKEANTQFVGNFIDCFRFASTKYLMIMSDEDEFNMDALEKLLNIFRKNPELGGVRAGIGVKSCHEGYGNAFSRGDEIFNSGFEALHGYSLSNNYVSGILYNRAIVLELGLIDRLELNAQKYTDYPHVYLDMLISALAPMATSSIISGFEGKPQVVLENGLATNDSRMSVYSGMYTYGRRLDQLVVERDALFEAVNLLPNGFCSDTFYNTYLKLCVKFLKIILVANTNLYENNSLNLVYLADTTNTFMVGAVRDYPDFLQYSTLFVSELKRVTKVMQTAYSKKQQLKY